MRKIFLLLLFMAAFCQAQSGASADPGFNVPYLYLWPTSGSAVGDMVLQSDGKIVISGYTPANGTKILRLNSNGSTDTGFPMIDVVEGGLLTQLPDGDILVGADIVVGAATKAMVRINPNGSIDPGFTYPSQFDSYNINFIRVQPNGKILVGGEFPEKLIRLNANGTRDISFMTLNEYEIVYDVLPLPNGKMIVAGKTYYIDPNSFESLYNILKINANGSIDTSFMAGSGFLGSNGYTRSLALQPDGKVLVGGRFMNYDGHLSAGIARITQDGAYDDTFQSPLFGDCDIRSILVRADGNILLGGSFSITQRTNLALLLPNGTPSSSIFNNPVNGYLGNNMEFNPDWYSVNRVIEQPDGKILFCGYYGESSGVYHCEGITRILGTNTYPMTGYTRLDLQNDGCSTTDAGVPHLKYKLVNGVNESYYYTNAEGYHSVSLKNGTSVITPILDNPTWFTISPASITINMPSAANYYNQNFCMTPNGVHHDVDVSIVPARPAVVGGETIYNVIVKNNGTETESGTVRFTFDEQYCNYVLSTPQVSSIAPGLAIWNFDSLAPLASSEFRIKLLFNTPTSIPPLLMNDILQFESLVSVVSDEVAENDIAQIYQTAVASFDPNDKTCLEGSIIGIDQVGEYVHYIIRFENMGTWPAEDIVVADLIDTEKYDISSLSPLVSSHLFTTRVTTGNKVEFLFNNIGLPFEAGQNNGFVAFKIRTKNNLQVGDTFSNNAEIFFDSNLPIITNIATTTVDNFLGSSQFAVEGLSLYPIPANDKLYIGNTKDLEIETLSIYNFLGQLMFKGGYQNHEVIEISYLTAGTYFLQLKTDSGTLAIKFCKL